MENSNVNRTTVIAIHLFRAANHMSEKLGYYIAFHVFSWGLPAILIIIAFAGDYFQKNAFTKWWNSFISTFTPS